MERILLKRWFQLTLWAVATFVAGVIVAQNTLGGSSVPPERPDRVEFHGGSLTRGALVPLTDAEASLAGWTEAAGQCIQGHGRFFDKEQAPYNLIYDLDGSLIGIYLFSLTEMPSPPWRFTEATAATYPQLGLEHWALSLFFNDPSRPCVTKVVE